MNAARLPRGLDLAVSGWLLFWASLIVVITHAGAHGFAALVILLGAVGWIVLARRTPLRGRAVLYGLAWSFLFFWMIISTNWGERNANTALRLGGQVILMLSLPALLATRGDGARAALAHVVLATALAGVLVMLADVLSGFGLNLALDPMEDGGTMWRRQSDAEMHLGRAQVAWAVMAPVLVALYFTRLPRRWAWLAAGAFLALLLGGSLANRLATPLLIIGAAALAMMLARALPKLAVKLPLWLSAGTMLLAPLVGLAAGLVPETTLARLPLSWDHRLRMWDYTLARILERPVTGHGLDASRTLQDSFTTRIGVDIPFVSLHPHNVGLQVWLELGAVGAVFAAGAILSMRGPLERLAGRDGWRRATVAGLIMAATVGAAVTVGAWQYWWWGLVGLAFALVTLIDRRQGPSSPSSVLNLRRSVG